MASKNAEGVAKEVIKMAGKGKKVNFQEIQKKYGYSKTSAHAMNVKRTKTYKSIINPFVQSMIEERDAAIAEMKKKRPFAKYQDLSGVINKFTHDIELLSGNETDRVGGESKIIILDL